MRLRSLLFTSAFLASILLSTTTSAHAQPRSKTPYPADYKVPAEDLAKWAGRLRKLCPKNGWTTKIENNDILIEREQMVEFSKRGQMVWRPKSEKMGVYRLRLRFEPLLSRDKYEQLQTENVVTKTEQTALLEKHGLAEIQDKLYNRDLAETFEARKQAYFEEARKLSFTRLPDLFSTDYSIKLYCSWSQSQYEEDDDAVSADCYAVTKVLAGSFGKYNYTPTIVEVLSGIESEAAAVPTP